MPPTPQTVQLTGQKQSQQQYDPSKGPPVQNAASLHTPPPQLPGRLQPVNAPMTPLPAALQLSQQQPQIVESPAQPQENQIHQRIAELRKEGLWSLRRLPKLQEAPRPKSHWDYLLEEMQWMATDFAQERKWKMATAKKVFDEHYFST
ncbi:EP400 protein, partial [Upupa epops]|nr:EP400 protein [Upupa epops]